LLSVIRASNPNRAVVVGPSGWNGIWKLDKLRLPADDHRLIVTVHHYNPFQFTHQGASWSQGSDKWLGKTWTGTTEEQQALDKDFDRAAAWAKKHDRPIYLGEFGAYSKAPMDSRVTWTRAVVGAAERSGFSWSYWEFAAGFGVYDPAAHAWREPLLRALLPSAKLSSAK
jgi:endoglucanase